ncbi:hypothetical protein [Sulfurimonas sp. NWX367]|uniref:hypothetical protein n=1 Tax=Sulfurimonas sp. NWX367 TaxID=2925413 RepID=UPI00320470CA
MNIEIITARNEHLQENTILHAIASLGYTAEVHECHTIQDLHQTVQRKPHLAILTLNNIVTEDGEKIWLCEFFKKNNINFTGSDKKALLFDADTELAKSYLKEKGISTSRYFIADAEKYLRDYDIPINYPLVVKPARSLQCQEENKCFTVNSFSEFEKSVSSLSNKYNIPVLIEEYLDGEDYLVSIIKTKEDAMLISSAKVLRSNNGNKKILENIEDQTIKESVENLAIDAYIDLGIRDFGQISIRTNQSGQCFFMRTNLNPDITDKNSSFIETFAAGLNLDYDAIIKHILQECSKRD